MPESNSELHPTRAHWPAIPLLSSEKAPPTGMPAAQGDSVMELSESALAYTTGLAETFDILGSAAVILNDRGRVIAANRTAKATLRRELRIARGRLIAVDRETSDKIVQLVRQVTSSPEGMALGLPFAVPRLGRKPVVVYTIRLEAQDRFSHACALIIIVDLQMRPTPAEAHLRQIFGLTSAESRLVGQLSRGETLEAAAKLLQITKETARAQLKAVFAKTETGRQSELVALIARLVADRQRN